MKLLVAGAAAAAIAVAVAAPVVAAQSGEDKPARPAPSADQNPGQDASEQGRESSARGRAHRDAMKEWQECVADQGKDACTKPSPPGHTKPRAKGVGPGPASEHGNGHGYGREHAPGQQKDKRESVD